MLTSKKNNTPSPRSILHVHIYIQLVLNYGCGGHFFGKGSENGRRAFTDGKTHQKENALRESHRRTAVLAIKARGSRAETRLIDPSGLTVSIPHVALDNSLLAYQACI